MAWNDEPASGALRMYHIPGCPFSERVELLLDLKGLHEVMADHVIDISKPRPEWLLRKTRGTTALPALELENGETLKESMVIMRYFEDRFPNGRSRAAILTSMPSRRCCARLTAPSPAPATA